MKKTNLPLVGRLWKGSGWEDSEGITIGLEIGHLTKITFGSFQNGSSGENCVKKVCGEVGIKCRQSCTVALVFCTKLYKKLPVSPCSFSQFSFPFNFGTANALVVLQRGTLTLSCLFSNTLLAIFDIFFRSRIIHRFVPKMGQN